MAKNPNEKDRPINGVDPDDYEREFRYDSIWAQAKRISEEVKPRSAKYKGLVESRDINLETLDYLQKNFPNGGSSEDLIRADLARVDSRIGRYESRAQEIAQSRFSNVLKSTYSSSSVNGEVSRLSRENS